MKKIIFRFLASLILMSGMLFSLQGCKDKKTTPKSSVSPTPVVTKAEADSSICGIANEDFGMSTFAITTEDGRSVQVVRTRNDGTDGDIYGDVAPGDKFVMTTTDDGESLGVAINVTQVERFTKKYRVLNARLILNPENAPDTVNVLHLSTDSLVAVGREKHIYTSSQRKDRGERKEKPHSKQRSRVVLK